MASPDVSIVLPTFNRVQYLRPAIASVFAQTFTNWELIIADDGSQQATADYIGGLADPPQVTVMRLPHTGNPGAVRNAACRAARGEYVAFLDSDDVWLPEKLAVQLDALRRRPERGWSHTAFTLIDERGELLTGARARSWSAASGWLLERLIRMDTVIAIPSVMVRRTLLQSVGGFDPRQRMCEDYDLWLRLAAVSEIEGVHETLLHVRTHGEHFHRDPVVFEDRGRALEKMLVGSTDRALRSLLRRERAKVAAGLAHSQATLGGRWAALRTLARSSPYSWAYRDWWLGGAKAAARAVVPAAILPAARAVAARVRAPS